MSRPSDALRAAAHQQGMLITAHRGTAIASVGQNTLLAARAAFASGADIVELDATVSADGQVYAFHDGTEDEALGIHDNLATLDSTTIATLKHRGSHPERPVRVPLLADVLAPLNGSGAFVNLDRSWFWWPLVLDEVTALGMNDQVLVKFPANQPALADVLREHAPGLPTMTICRTLAEMEWSAALPGLDVCAVELIADSPDHELAQQAAVERAHDLGLLVFVNCEVLSGGPPLYAGWDDEQALHDPDQPWERLAGLGVDIIQTDWPWLANAWRSRRATLVP